MGQLHFPPGSFWWLEHLSLLAPKEAVTPFLESTPVSVTHRHGFEKLLISQRSLEEAVGTNGMFLCCS